MYIPKHFEETDSEIIAELIRRVGFGIVVSVKNGEPVATHLPLELEEDENGEKVITGHMARANEQWQTFEQNTNIVAIFQDAHSYISPRWYQETSVPTWSYMAVHVYGKPRVITDEKETRAVLTRLVNRYETDENGAALYRLENLPSDYLDKLQRGMVAFQIKIERIEARFKLGQNKSFEANENVILELEKSGDWNSLQIAREMRRIYGKEI